MRKIIRCDTEAEAKRITEAYSKAMTQAKTFYNIAESKKAGKIVLTIG